MYFSGHSFPLSEIKRWHKVWRYGMPYKILQCSKISTKTIYIFHGVSFSMTRRAVIVVVEIIKIWQSTNIKYTKCWDESTYCNDNVTLFAVSNGWNMARWLSLYVLVNCYWFPHHQHLAEYRGRTSSIVKLWLLFAMQIRSLNFTASFHDRHCLGSGYILGGIKSLVPCGRE